VEISRRRFARISEWRVNSTRPILMKDFGGDDYLESTSNGAARRGSHTFGLQVPVTLSISTETNSLEHRE
jgi:hypothetical protein